MALAAPTDTSLRELAHRAANGIDVTLLWDERADTVSVRALDELSGQLLELRPKRNEALEAFYHPYSYAL
jgi:hypothetical protein